MRNKKIVALICCMGALVACDKHDPILPGVRTAIFDSGNVSVMNTTVPNVPAAAKDIIAEDCPYRQDAANIVWDGERRIFTGFPTSNAVKNDAKPVCKGGFVYAGLTTGELIKVNPKNRHVMWIADIYRDSNLTGGASVLDIVAPITLDGDFVYVGGVGDAFCKINASTGKKKWCANVGTALPYVYTDSVIYVVGGDANLYAISTTDGAIYWRSAVKKMAAPVLENGRIKVDRETFDAATGAKEK